MGKKADQSEAKFDKKLAEIAEYETEAYQQEQKLKLKRKKEKEMKNQERINKAKNLLLVLLTFVILGTGAYIYGKTVGYAEKANEQARINAEAAKLVEQLKSKR